MARIIKINDVDNVAVALQDLKKGDVENGVTLLDNIPCGHKFALVDIKANENVIKYGYPIGHAYIDIKAGQHVHVQNVKTNLGDELEYSYKQNFREVPKFNKDVKINVYRRKNGQVGIRNYLYIVPLVGCVNSQAEQIRKNVLAQVDTSKFDGVIVTKHPYGCSQMGGDHVNTVDELHAIVHQPNAGGVLVFALGCENNQLEPFKASLGEYDEERVKFLKAQDVADEVEEGTKLCLELYNVMKNDKRVPGSLQDITIGLKCGGSDGFSGITANPLVGRLSDFVVDNGGSTILTEVPEMFGAELILMERAKDKPTFEKIVKLINGFKGYYASHNQVCYENPSPGNKAGGISTLEDKALGCTQKSGLGKVVDVLYVGDHVKEKGLNLLNGPGNDMVACTNLAAAGCHLILFTTGRGTPFGTIVPTIKVGTNSRISNLKSNWIDFNAGRIVDGESYDDVFASFIDKIVDVINGEKANNEKNEFQEISIFKDGVTL